VHNVKVIMGGNVLGASHVRETDGRCRVGKVRLGSKARTTASTTVDISRRRVDIPQKHAQRLLQLGRISSDQTIPDRVVAIPTWSNSSARSLDNLAAKHLVEIVDAEYRLRV